MFGTRRIQLTGAIGEVLAFSRMEAREALGRPFQLDLEVLALDHAFDLSSLLGKPLAVEAELQSGAYRHFHGYVTRFAMAGSAGRHARYTATLRPWLWLLTRTSNCRIFQGKTVPEIVKQIFRENGFTDFKESLDGKYRTWDYLVQYRESDFNFVSRLLEQEGIYYFFNHEAEKHTLVLTDSYAAHKEQGLEVVPYYPPTEHAQRDQDHIDTWSASRQIQSGSYVSNDYDFERPTANLFSTLAVKKEHPQSQGELYDYPGEYLTAAHGEQHVRVRLEERHADHEVSEGAGNVRALVAGGLVQMMGYPRHDQNKEYLVVSTVQQLVGNSVESLTETGSASYRCSFTCIDSHTPYRTPRTTPKPRVEGPQTAVVVGKEKEEIWTDKHGRVKVHFFWDRENNPDAPPDPHLANSKDPPRKEEESSCWVRVAQVWAGAGWGGMHIPRVGQEVIVDFLEGDPDRPIITGRLYNGKNRPPYDLPANQTQSGIKSRSTQGGAPGNFNEIRFEDKKDAEELYIQAEKNQRTLVKNDQSITVQANRTLNVTGNETIGVDGERTTTVKLKETQTYKNLRSVDVTETDSVTVGQARTETFNGGRTATIKQYDDTVVTGGNKSVTVDQQYNLDAKEHISLTQGGNKLFVKDQIFGESIGDIQLKNGGCHLIAEQGGNLTLKASQQIQLQCGAASITLKMDGSVIIDGVTGISVSSGGSLVTVKPDGSTMAGPKVGVNGSALVEVAAPIVKVG
jgi:type VI secretion system secreted protein VgrG